MHKKVACKDTPACAVNGVLAVDRRGTVTLADRRVEILFDRDRRSLAGRHIEEALPFIGSAVSESLGNGNEVRDLHLSENGCRLSVDILLQRKQKEVAGAVCIFHDLEAPDCRTEGLAAQRELYRQLEAIFKSSSDGIWVCSSKGEIIRLNKASERLNGIRAEEVIGKNVSIMEEKGIVDRNVTPEVLRTGRKVSALQYINRTKKYLLVTGTPVLDRNGDLTMVVVNERDMTSLNAIKAKLEHSYKLTEKAKDELLELSLKESGMTEFVAECEQMKEVCRAAIKLSKLETSTILLLGESGTGKGLMAKFIHKNGTHQKKPFVQIHCPALPEHLLEAELFGYERGAYTGARTQGKVGLIELAEGGSLFLDEIGDLPMAVQAKLLKYLDDNEVMRLGGVQPRKINCTVIAATNRNLKELVRKRRFRQDLYFRLDMFTLVIPPLRDRPEDVLQLVQTYLRQFNKKHKAGKRISADAFDVLQRYPFPGNVRELKNIIEKAVVMCDENLLDDYLYRSIGRQVSLSCAVPERQVPRAQVNLSEELQKVERDLVAGAMRRSSSTAGLARELGVSQPTAYRKMKKYGLTFS